MKTAASISNMMSGNVIPRAYEFSGLSLEAEIVLLCSRSELSTDHIDRLSSMLGQEPNSEYIFNLAYRNGVLPLVCNNLLENFRFELTEETMATAGELCRHHALRNLSMTGKLLEILRMFESAGIASVPFKGPTLAMRLYNSTTLRQFIDLDILVMPRHFDRAIDLLLDKGYEVFPDSGHRSRSTFGINRRKDVSLMHPDDKYRVELHWKLSGSHFSMPLQLSRLWRRMDTTDLGGLRLSTLPFNDLFVYLCLHAARHGFERLEWICDLNELIRSENAADWTELREHARVHGCERVVELALFLVLDLFGTRAPYPEFHRIEADGQFAKIARTVRDRLFTDEPTSNGIGDWYGYHLMLKEKRSDRIKLHMFYIGWYLKLIFRPNSADKAIFPLPASFYPLYFILRPARLIYNYFSKQTPMR